MQDFIKQLLLVTLLIFFAVICTANAQPETWYSWNFDQTGNAEGWQPTHSLSVFYVANGTLTTKVTGPDPYMNGPGGLSIDSGRYGYVEIRMRNTHDTGAEFFWTTTEQPTFVAGLEYGFTLIPDGEFHVYQVPVRKSDKWHGTITRLRLDPGEGSERAVNEGAVVEIDYIRVVHLGSRLQIVSFSADQQLIAPGDTIGLVLKTANTGDEDITAATAQIDPPKNLKLIEGDPSQPLPALKPGDDQQIEWWVSPIDTGAYLVSVMVQLRDSTELADSCAFRVNLPISDLPPAIPASAQSFQTPNGHIILENNQIRLAFIRMGSGFGPILLYAARANSFWEKIGIIGSVASLSHQLSTGEKVTQTIAPDIEMAVGGDSLRFIAEFQDPDAVHWQAQFDFYFKNDKVIHFRYGLTANSTRHLVNFTGPLLRLGDGGFGAQKNEALFPGLEYLIGDEESSSTLDVDTPKNQRYLPHPYKVTIPLMSVSANGLVIGMDWDPLQVWDSRSQRYPQPLFASPNSWDGQDNHLMGLVLPPTPDWRQENQPIASQPFTVESGQEVALHGDIFVLESVDELAGLKWWLDQHGITQLPSRPRSYEDDVRLNVESFMDVLWVPSDLGWHLVLHDPWGPQSDHQIANQVWMGSLYFDDPQKQATLRQQMGKVADKLINQTYNPAGMGWDFSFRYGELDRTWSPLIRWAAGHSKGQTADGGWLYSGDPALQNQGQTSVGTCAMKAYVLLQAARISGDAYCLRQGLKALEFMKQFRVPRGAQVWEVPLHAPDVLAAAHAVLAYLEGFRVTQNAEYLAQAVRWAYSGLPFIYLWSAHDRPAMAYGSIPVFGATWYTSPWFGRVVQWNGLDYAYALLKLAEFDSTRDWRKIAEGLTIFGMQIQRTEQTAYPENKGMYPDAYSMMLGDEAYHWDLAPTKIMQNVLALLGQDPDVHTLILPLNEGKIHVNSGIRFSANLVSSTLTITPVPIFADMAYFVIPKIKKPAKVKFENIELPFADDVDDVAPGWSYSLDGNAIIKVLVRDETETIKVEPIAMIEPNVEPQWNFNQDGYGEGWIPNPYLQQIQVVQGMLQGTSTWIDPWITGPSVSISADQYDSCAIRMRVSKGNWAQLFWVRNDQPSYDEAKSQRIRLHADGSFHIYAFSLAEHPQWVNTITQLRFDPTDASGADIGIDYIKLLPSTATLVASDPHTIPQRFRLYPTFPNPTSHSATFAFDLDKPGWTTLTIYDLLGRKVVDLIKGKQNAGRKIVRWNGRDKRGQSVSAGTYFCRLVQDDDAGNHKTAAQKIVVISVQQ